MNTRQRRISDKPALASNPCGDTDQLVPLPRRLRGLQAKQAALHARLAREWREMVQKIKKAISTVKALTLDDNAPQGDWVVNELWLVLQEVHRLNLLRVSDTEVFSELVERVQKP